MIGVRNYATDCDRNNNARVLLAHAPLCTSCLILHSETREIVVASPNDYFLSHRQQEIFVAGIKEVVQ